MLRGTYHLEAPSPVLRPALQTCPSPTHLRTASCCIKTILTEPPSNNQEALRLAEAQVQNLQLRHSDALTSKLYLNAKDAARVCRLASKEFTAKSDVNSDVNSITTCRIHGGGDDGGGSPSQREILPHERSRILHSWYFLKRHAESLSPLGQQHHQSLTQEVWAITAVQAYVLWSMVIFVCQNMDWDAQEVRISLPISCAHRHRPISHPPSLFHKKRSLA